MLNLLKTALPVSAKQQLRAIKRRLTKNTIKEASDAYLNAITQDVKTQSNNVSTVNSSPSTLFKTFKYYKVNPSVLNLDWWSNFVYAASSTDEQSYEIQRRLIKQIDKLSPNSIDIADFLHFYALALRVGLFNIGYSLREKAKESATDNIEKHIKLSKQNFLLAISALMENGNINKIDEFLKVREDLSKEELVTIYHLRNLYSNDNFLSVDPWHEIKEINDESFHKFVKSQNIAIVGPAKTDKADAKTIDNFGLVARCNYKTQGVGVDELVKGLRCDITYFNGEQAIYFASQEDIQWPSDIKWAVCKSPNHAHLVQSRLTHHQSNDSLSYCTYTRYLNNMSTILFNGGLNMIPLIVLDLLRFSVNKLYIFHTDLMLTVQRSEHYYPKEWNRESQRQSLFLRGISKFHDPVTQYCILQNLFNSGRITGDSRFREVMELGVQKYMQQLQNIYGTAGRITLS